MSLRSIPGMLASVRGHAWSVWGATTILGPLGLVGLLLAGALLADSYLVLAPPIRLLMLSAIIVALAATLVRAITTRPITGDQELALLIERRHPELDNVLINCLQLAEERTTTGEHFVGAIAEEAEKNLTKISPKSAVSKRTLAVAAVVVAGAAGSIFALAIQDQAGLAMGLHRVLLPLADNTLTRILHITPGDTDVVRHSDLVIAAQIGGRVPTKARLVLTYPDGRRQNLTMAGVTKELPDRLMCKINHVEQSFRYQVVAGDDRSRTFFLRVHPRPVITKIVQTIVLPEYIHTKPIQKIGGTIAALIGSRIQLIVHTSLKPREGWIKYNAQLPQPLSFSDGIGRAHLLVNRRGRYNIDIVSDQGFHNEPAAFDVLPIADRVPSIQIVEPVGEVTVDIDDQIELSLRAEDDFALREIALIQADASEPSAQTRDVQRWVMSTRDRLQFDQQILVRVADIGVDEDKPVMIKALAFDFRPDSRPEMSNSITIRLRRPAIESAATDRSTGSINDLIAKQRMNIGECQILNGKDTRGELSTVIARQEEIRQDAIELSQSKSLRQDGVLPAMIQQRLVDLAQTLMVLAIEQLRDAEQAHEYSPAMERAIRTQHAILRALELAESRPDEQLDQQVTITHMLMELISKQKILRANTISDSSHSDALSVRQRLLARKTASLQSIVQSEADTGAGGDPQLAARYGQMAQAFDQREVRPNMLLAAQRLADNARELALGKQDRVLADLLAIANLLHEALLVEAKEDLQQMTEGLANAQQRVEKMIDVQQAITEVGKQLKSMEDLTEGRTTAPDDVADLAEARENLTETIEQLVEDMHLLPDMVVSNDLLAELSEIYEEVHQAESSEFDPVSEIAVERDEALLEQLRRMQKEMGKRLEDLDMWLSDRPDSIKWNQESWDKDEIGKIPLVDLPSALDDLVGDLLEQSEQLSQQAEDSASNVAIPDPVVGWAVMDGPMPSWAAKGKSGNEKPNDMEQVGRSGAGRQGRSSGELVGDTMKGLEGADVETRRTNDGLQSGEVKEEVPDKMDVKATGGGKLAGTTNSEGLQGNSPPRDELRYRHLRQNQIRLQRNMESVYSRTKLLRLPTGQLDRALLELDAGGRRLAAQDLAGFARSQQKVVKALRQTHTDLAGKTILFGPGWSVLPRQAGEGAMGEPVPQAYEQAVAQYMRRIAE